MFADAVRKHGNEGLPVDIVSISEYCDIRPEPGFADEPEDRYELAESIAARCVEKNIFYENETGQFVRALLMPAGVVKELRYKYRNQKDFRIELIATELNVTTVMIKERLIELGLQYEGTIYE